jgi:CheY-like chemotaxis protein
MTIKALELVLNLNEPRRILIIEDKVSFALRLRKFLVRRGHSVHSYSGVERGGDVLFGIDPHHDDAPACLELTQYDVCFLDHYFAGDDFNGSSFLTVLADFPIRVCGMSSVDSANEAMRRRGALTALRKDLLDQLLTL